ncbi:BTAD domain-containing putative transcriptional regulator [Stackebrandtia nassauensis]|uniref:Transcriptional regulator, winged helix family n=1 Tax=Stackebrandtia nassauensis (strain DSM 44728 / CIP 108903 / NRRL B-16338 / NBRC 102104 / LLR-40K-21) TaxID=446470 RepID=D3PX74_STANL|nr:BTAD domain-containing putative transcriptional regulator [Stackebrandtia nassauensis]ADD41337.1 transcriptional regulator, winged helix family [Stackebrandtia nassauensis DSM 44728]
MRIELLGPVRAYTQDDTPVPLGGLRLRMLLARLALVPGSTVTASTLIDELWGADAPAQAGNALQALVSRLRKAFGDVGSVASVASGYRLSATEPDVDTHRFEELAVRGRRELADGRAGQAAAVLSAALELWRGEALADVRDAPFARPVVVRLDELRAAAVEDHAEAMLRLGRHAEVLADLETATTEHPLRERLAALRMRALHAAGRQAEALAVYESIRGELAERLGVDPDEVLRQAHLAVLRGETDRPRPPEPVSGRLPLRLTSFVGRDDELKRLAEQLSTSRLVTVVGPGGCGKTRLAVEAVSRHRLHETGRVWFAPLAGVGSGEDVADSVLGNLDARGADPASALRPGRSADPLDRIVDLLAGDEALLVLDNCEHLVAACAVFAHRLLDRLPRLTILATSREPLGITGEALCPLGPLETPDDATGLDAADTAAVRLFTDRAAAVRPGFAATASNLELIVEICRRLDGLPLAVELAAARLRALSLEQIAKRLDDRFRLLTSGSRTALPRQRTLQAVIEWSWDLLSDAEQTLARRLSLFAGGAGLAGLEAVCGNDQAGDPVYVVGSLIEKSIVEAIGGDEPRYRMLESVRSFAAERLDAAGERAAVAERFRRYFLTLAEETGPRLHGREQLAAVAVFDTEYDNLVAALRSAIDASDADTAQRLLSAVIYHWTVFGKVARLYDFTDQVLGFGDELPADARAAFSLLRLLNEDAETTVETIRAVEGDRMRQTLDECVRTDALRRYPLLMLIALPVASFRGYDDLWESELARGARHPDTWVRAGAAWVETFIRADRGDWAAASRARDVALRGFSDVGDWLGQSMLLVSTAQAAAIEGRHAEALDLYERAIAVDVELAWDTEIYHRTMLAAELLRGGDAEAAGLELDEALRRARLGGHRQAEIPILVGYADLHRHNRDFGRADNTMAELAALTKRLSLPDESAEALGALPRMSIRLSAGDTRGARRLFPGALAAATGMLELPSAAELLARLLAAEDAPLAAARALGWSQAIRGAFDRGNPELASLTDRLRDRLGDNAFQSAFDEASATPRAEAFTRLTEAAG